MSGGDSLTIVYCRYTTIKNCNISNASQFGIGLKNTTDTIIIENNNIYNNDVDGIYFCNADTITDAGGFVINNRIYNNGRSGILVGDHTNATLIDNTIKNNGHDPIIPFFIWKAGIIVWKFSNPPIIENNTLEDNYKGIYVSYESEATISNSTILNSTLWDIHLISDYEYLTTLNTSFDKSKVAINSTNCNLTVKWFMHVGVVNETYSPVDGATVWINDNSGSEVDSDSTGSDGFLRWVICTEYVQDQSTITYYTAHNVTASNATLTGYAFPEPFMDRSKEVYVMLGATGYNLYLHQGWNFISLPLVPPSTAVLDVLSFIDGKYDFVEAYDNFNKKWITYNTLKPPHMNELQDLDHTMGFWINMLVPDVILLVKGGIPTTTDILLYQGWNLVGYPTLTEGMTVGSAMSGLGVNYMVKGYDPTRPDRLRVLADSDIMYTGEAYWIWVDAGTAWSVSW